MRSRSVVFLFFFFSCACLFRVLIIHVLPLLLKTRQDSCNRALHSFLLLPLDVIPVYFVVSSSFFLLPREIKFNSAGVVLSVLRFGSKLLLNGVQAPTLTAPFAKAGDK